MSDLVYAERREKDHTELERWKEQRAYFASSNLKTHTQINVRRFKKANVDILFAIKRAKGAWNFSRSILLS